MTTTQAHRLLTATPPHSLLSGHQPHRRVCTHTSLVFTTWQVVSLDHIGGMGQIAPRMASVTQSARTILFPRCFSNNNK